MTFGEVASRMCLHPKNEALEEPSLISFCVVFIHLHEAPIGMEKALHQAR